MTNFQTTTESVENTSNQVEVIRYIRPRAYEYGEYAEKTNLYGITLVFNIDYDTREVVASWSICNGDNFQKKEGVRRAKKNAQNFKFPLSQIEEESLSFALANDLLDFTGMDAEQFYMYEDFQEWISLFLAASRKLKG